ncbi:MAG: TonB-dependent receptor domain-containing protein, partial [Aurantibacter sp.]
NDKLRLTTLYFNRKEKNFVFFDGANSRYLNSPNKIDAQGVEIELDWKPMERIRLNSNYAFTERKGDNAIRIPKHKINAILGYEFNKRTFTSLSYSYTGQRFDTDFTVFSDVRLDPYSRVDFYISHKIFPGRFKVFFNLQNLFNEDYVEIIGFTTRGRNVRVGATLTL